MLVTRCDKADDQCDEGVEQDALGGIEEHVLHDGVVDGEVLRSPSSVP